jgi:hypothetical protein
MLILHSASPYYKESDGTSVVSLCLVQVLYVDHWLATIKDMTECAQLRLRDSPRA